MVTFDFFLIGVASELGDDAIERLEFFLSLEDRFFFGLSVSDDDNFE
jgi:hypothetical protein